MGTNLRRYVPLFAVLYVSVLVIARALGMNEFATALASIGGLLQLEDASVVSPAELAAAGAMLSGFVMKILSVAAKAKRG